MAKDGKIKAHIEVTLPSGGKVNFEVEGSKLSSLSELPRYLRDRLQESVNDIAIPGGDNDAMQSQLDALVNKSMALESENQALRAELTKLGQQTDRPEDAPKRRGRPPKDS